MKKPPDIYKCIKMPLHKLLINNDHSLIINEAVFRTHKIIIKAYQLVRLWILCKYNQGDIIPKINKDTFCTAFRVIKKNSIGKESELYKQFNNLYSFEKEDASQLTQVLTQYSSVEMVTAYENNIKLHFFDYLRRYVNSYWKTMFEKEIVNKTLKLKTLYRELYIVKKDLLEGTLLCNEKYHNWLKENRFNIVPMQFKESYHYDIKVDPQKYIKNMIWMNIQLEKMEGKMFQFFPLRNKIVQGFMHLDNTTIINLLVESNKKKNYKTNISDIKKHLWNKYFKWSIIKKAEPKNYIFDFGLMTDGYNASIRFIHIDELVKKIKSQDSKRKGRQETKGLTKEKRKERRELINDKYESSKAKTKKIKDEKKKKTRPENNVEFPYIDEINIEILKSKDYVVVDPGKRDLMTIMNKRGDILRYSNSRRIKDTKRLEYTKVLNNYRIKKGIIQIEELLNKGDNINSKTCNVESFKKYLTLKNSINSELFNLYKDEKFRQYRWYSHINKKRSEDNMLNLIEEKYGKDINIIYGDWAQGKQMRNYMSTPNLGLKRKLTERFNVYNIDEYRSSCLHYKTEKRCENIKLKDKNGKMRKKHAILTYKMEKKGIGCINRDNNSCKNLLKIVSHFLKTGERLENYKRSVRNPDHRLKDTNLISTLIEEFTSTIVRDYYGQMVSSQSIRERHVEQSYKII